jgi:hypothetical protein
VICGSNFDKWGMNMGTSFLVELLDYGVSMFRVKTLRSSSLVVPSNDGRFLVEDIV